MNEFLKHDGKIYKLVTDPKVLKAILGREATIPDTANPKSTFLATVQHCGVNGQGMRKRMRKEAQCVVEATTASEAAAAIEKVFENAEACGHVIKLEQPVALAGDELAVSIFGEF